MSGEFPILYSMPDSTGLAVLIALRWARADHELRLVAREDIRKAAFLEINPTGRVPAVTAEGQAVLTEAHALLLLLADSHPDSRLAPTSSRPLERYRLEQMLAFMTGEVHAAFNVYLNPEVVLDDDEEADAIRLTASRRIAPMLAQLDASLGNNPYLLDEKTVADPYLYVLTRWARSMAQDLSATPGLARFRSRMETDPAVIASLADHEMMPIGTP